MQLIPRYLFENSVTIVGSELGLSTEIMPVYTREIKIYRGIDNTIQFRLLNSDHKPIDVDPYEIKFVAFDDDQQLVLDLLGEIYNPTDSTIHKGKFTVTIPERDLLNLERQWLKYNIYLVDAENNKTITYVDSHYDNNATLFIDDYAFPMPGKSAELKTFYSDNGVWYSETHEVAPAKHGSEGLHTVAVYSKEYEGTVVLEATLDITPNDADWHPIQIFNYEGDELGPTGTTFRGNFSFFRVKTTADPTDKISKVLIRN